jgi:hypothetical protein
MDTWDWVGLVLGVLVAIWANRRGYAWWAFIFASPIVGAIALGILPNLSEPGKEFENKEELVRKGNIVGLWISGLTFGFLMIAGAMNK